MRIRILLTGLGALLLSAQFQTRIHAQPPGQIATQAESQIAGHIVITIGSVFIERNTGTTETAVRRSEIHAGDTLVTGNDGIVHIRFIDSALVSLRCNSELEVVSYQYEDSNSDNVDLYLKRGTARTITGSIQHSNYRFRTDIAVITPIGTDFEVAVVSSSKANFGVYDGGINIRSMLGEVNLGLGGDYDFGSADDLGPPTGLSVQPPALGSSTILRVQTTAGQSSNIASSCADA